jgi:hypothetical protein
MKQQKRKVREDVRDLPLKVKAEMALKEAVAEALAEHKRQGNPGEEILLCCRILQYDGR